MCNFLQVRDRSVSKLQDDMSKLGVDISNNENAHFKKTKQRSRSTGPPTKRVKMDTSDSVALNRSRSLSKPPRNELGVKDVAVSITFICII